MEDFEVRQALAIIKERVQEIKQDEEWKENIANEWNQIAEEDDQINNAGGRRPDDAMSMGSRASDRSGVSRRSLKSVAESVRSKAVDNNEDWDQSVRSKS